MPVLQDWAFSVPLPRFWLVSSQITLSSSFLAPYGLIHYHELPSYSRILMTVVPLCVCCCFSHQPCVKATSVHNSTKAVHAKTGWPFFLGSGLHSVLTLQHRLLPSPHNLSLLLCKKFLSADVFLEQLISTPSSLHLIKAGKKTCSFLPLFVL